MTVPGYPDYQRVSLASGVLLGSFTGAVPSDTQVFKGYVGNWQALNTNWNSTNKTSLAYYDVEYVYWTDNTFTTIIGEQIEVRSSEIQAFSQHVPQSPWLTVDIIYESGSALGNLVWSMYGSQILTSCAKIGGNNTPLISLHELVAPGVTSFPQGLTIPGTCSLICTTNGVPVVVDIQAYNPGVSGYQNFAELGLLTASLDYTLISSVPDAPLNVQISNFNTGSVTVNVYLSVLS